MAHKNMSIPSIASRAVFDNISESVSFICPVIWAYSNTKMEFHIQSEKAVCLGGIENMNKTILHFSSFFFVFIKFPSKLEGNV